MRLAAFLVAAIALGTPPIGSEGPDIAVRADIYRFPLSATSRARGASGSGYLQLAPSPFGIAVTANGHLLYDLVLTTKRLRPPSALGAYRVYVAWVATPELDRYEKLGPVGESGELRVRISSMNKFILMITAEPSAEVAKRSGPIVLRGVSPSGLLQSFGSHELFSDMPHE